VYTNLKVPFLIELHEAKDLDKSHDEKEKNHEIIGVQSVIDSITFNCDFYQKDVSFQKLFMGIEKNHVKTAKKNEAKKT
jgi:hypothetical protein